MNKSKSYFLLAPNTSQPIKDDITQLIGFTHSKSPFGMPHLLWEKKVIYFGDLVSKVSARMHRKILSYDDRAILIKVVLQSIPLHTLSVVQLHKTTISQMEKIITNFFLE